MGAGREELTMLCRKCKKELPEGVPYCCWCGAKQVIEKRQRTRGNGQGSVYKDSRSGKWMAEVTLYLYNGPNGKTRRKTVKRQFPTKTVAINALPSLRELTPAPRSVYTFAALHDIYTHGHDYDSLSDSQRYKLDLAWTRLEPLHRMDITGATLDDLQRVIDESTSTYYPARDMKVLLSHLYTVAVKRDIVPYNRTEYIELPDAPKAKRERFSNEEVTKLIAACPTDSFADYIVLMIFTGLRPGELKSIELSNVNLDEMRIIGGIKTDAGIDREIPVPLIALEPLQRIYTAAKAEGRDTLWPCTRHKMDFYERYYACLEKHGVREMPPKTCRHTFFSLLTAAGVHTGLITEIGGHVDYETTVKNYVRISFEEKLNAMSAFDSFIK